MLPDLPALSLSDVGYTWLLGLSLWLGVVIVALFAAFSVFRRKAK